MTKFVYVGTYGAPHGKGKGIYVYKVENGHKWTLVQVIETSSPSFFCFNHKRDRLYGTNEIMHNFEDPGSVFAYSIDQTSGQLCHLSTQSTDGVHPCHLCLDYTEKYLFVANYKTGSVAVHKINADGSVGQQTDLMPGQGTLGPNAIRQEGPHAHMVTILANSQHDQQLLVVDLGTDAVFQFKFDWESGKIIRKPVASWITHPGAGPRHLQLSQDKKFLYVLNELDSTMSVFPYKLQENVPELQSISTLPEDFPVTELKWSSEVILHSSGKFLYGSNRVHDSIAIFSVDAKSGLLTLIGHQSTKGRTPRHFEIHEDFMYVGNQDTNTISIFKINPSSGKLEDINQLIDVPAPICIMFNYKLKL